MANGDFKPNIYPIMYWALAYGATAAIVLGLLLLLSRYITLVWFPVFAAGVIIGGYRNYRKQKQDWQHNAGLAAAAGSPVDEFRQAARDIASASRDLLTQDTAENTALPAPPASEPPQSPPPTPSDQIQNQPPR